MTIDEIHIQQEALRATTQYHLSERELADGMVSTSYYLLFSTTLPTGELRMKTALRDESGEIMDGYATIPPSHPNYTTWKAIIAEKDAYLARDQELQQAERQWRRENKMISDDPPNA